MGAILLLVGGGPFNPGPLTAAQPQATPLAGFASHAAFEEQCERCHEPWFGVTAPRCEQCHEDVARQRESGTGLHGRLVDTGRCALCHTDHRGRDANITFLSQREFDHFQVTGFSLAKHALDYAGAPLPCEGCHLEGHFTEDKLDCSDCHTAGDPDFTAEHVALFGGDCRACHDGIDTMAAFDHATVFVLDGAHAEVDCVDCHANQLFRDPPRQCVDCHAEPEIHAGQFGLDCARCHTTTAWAPAQLTRHTFPLDHGGRGQSECTVCHAQTYAQYDCYGCHDHTPADMEREHLKEDITDFANCVECHATGQEAEQERSP